MTQKKNKLIEAINSRAALGVVLTVLMGDSVIDHVRPRGEVQTHDHESFQLIRMEVDALRGVIEDHLESGCGCRKW